MEKGSTIIIPIDKESNQLKQEERWTLFIHEGTRETIGKQKKTQIKRNTGIGRKLNIGAQRTKIEIVTGEEGNGKETGSPKVLIEVRETE